MAAGSQPQHHTAECARDNNTTVVLQQLGAGELEEPRLESGIKSMLGIFSAMVLGGDWLSLLLLHRKWSPEVLLVLCNSIHGAQLIYMGDHLNPS